MKKSAIVKQIVKEAWEGETNFRPYDTHDLLAARKFVYNRPLVGKSLKTALHAEDALLCEILEMRNDIHPVTQRQLIERHEYIRRQLRDKQKRSK